MSSKCSEACVFLLLSLKFTCPPLHPITAWLNKGGIQGNIWSVLLVLKYQRELQGQWPHFCPHGMRSDSYQLAEKDKTFSKVGDHFGKASLLKLPHVLLCVQYSPQTKPGGEIVGLSLLHQAHRAEEGNSEEQKAAGGAWLWASIKTPSSPLAP